MKARDLIGRFIISDCIVQSQIHVIVKKFVNGQYKKTYRGIFSTELRLDNILNKYPNCDVRIVIEDGKITLVLFDESEVNS